MDQIKIGKFITQCRKEQGFTQLQLADKLNITDKAISKWETGKGLPDSSIMLELCEYLRINVNELLSGEHIVEENYQEKACENIISIAKESEKNRKTKNKLIILLSSVIASILVISFIIILYRNIEINVAYDSRLVQCNIREDKITCIFNGSSLVHLDYKAINYNDETLIFITGKMLLQNKIHSHFETWDSMAQLKDGESSRFLSKIEINKNTDLVECKENIKVYYTNISLKKIENSNDNKLNEIIKNSKLMIEN